MEARLSPTSPVRTTTSATTISTPRIITEYLTLLSRLDSRSCTGPTGQPTIEHQDEGLAAEPEGADGEVKPQALEAPPMTFSGENTLSE